VISSHSAVERAGDDLPPLANIGHFEGKLVKIQFLIEVKTAMRSTLCLLLLGGGMLFMLPEAHAEKPSLECPTPKGDPQVRKYSGYSVRLAQSSVRGNRCQALLTAPGDKVSKKVATDWALSINEISGTDVNGDGKPELIVQGYSGGAHCCYTYRIVGLTQGLPLIREIHNQVPVIFKTRDDGGVELHTGDGVFDYFLVPHANAVIPQLFLRLEGDKVVDLGPEHLADYDREIEKARSQLNAEELDKLRKSNYSEGMLFDQLLTVQKVMTIVLNYLYSGRQDEAWRSLDQMWPESDRERVKKLILERRSRGFITQMGQKPTVGS